MQFKYVFCKNKNKLLLQEDTWWKLTRRRNILDSKDGYYWLIYDYLKRLNNELYSQTGLYVKQFYRNRLDYKLCFTTIMNKTKLTSSDEYLDSISVIKFKYNDQYHIFKLDKYLLEGSTRNTLGTLTLLYK